MPSATQRQDLQYSHLWKYVVRGPCPGLNTLANHGLLPRSGKNITQADLVTAMRQGMNQDESLSVLLFRAAVQTNPAKDNATFSLPDLGRHNILEHDASLRRVLTTTTTPRCAVITQRIR